MPKNEAADPPRFAGSAEQRLDKFRQVRDQIAAKLRAWIAEL